MSQRNGSSEARDRLYGDLRAIQRRLTARRLLRMLAPALLLLAAYLLLRDLILPPGALDTGSLQALFLVAAVAGVGALILRALRESDLRRTAAHCDQRAGLDDLLLSAWSLGDGRRPVDAHWLDLLETNAAEQARELDPRQVAPLQVPKAAWVAIGLLVLWVGWRTAGRQGLLPRDFLTSQLGFATAESDQLLADLELGDAPVGPDSVEPPGSPLVLSTRQLSPALEGLTELQLANLAELGEASARSGELDGRPPGGEPGDGVRPPGDPADSEDGTPPSADSHPEAGLDDILQELGREQEGESPERGEDSAGARGESAPAGERQARAGGERREGEGDPDAPVQQVDFPLSQDAQARASEDGDADSTAASAGAAAEGAETAQQEAGGSMAKNPFGSSTGPQAGAVDPFGIATALEVTLELAILEQQKQERPEPEELTRRASPQKAAEVARRTVTARSGTESEDPILPTTTPWRFRELSQRFFAPDPETDPAVTGEPRPTTPRPVTPRPVTPRPTRQPPAGDSR